MESIVGIGNTASFPSKQIIENEFLFVQEMLDLDVFNNSAWSYRWFLFESSQFNNQEREIEYLLHSLAISPMNESIWTYMESLLIRCTDIYPSGLNRLRDAVRSTRVERSGIRHENVLKVLNERFGPQLTD